VVSFTPRPLYVREKSPLYALNRKLGGPQGQSGRRGEEKILDPTGTRTLNLLDNAFINSNVTQSYDILASFFVTFSCSVTGESIFKDYKPIKIQISIIKLYYIGSIYRGNVINQLRIFKNTSIWIQQK
jgi:hypothetical protein